MMDSTSFFRRASMRSISHSAADMPARCTPEADRRIAHRGGQAGHRVRPACTAQQHRAPEPQGCAWVTPLALGSRNDIRGALKAIDDLLHAIEHHFLKTNPTNYDFLDNVGGVDSLLDIVERGLKSRDAQSGTFGAPIRPIQPDSHASATLSRQFCGMTCGCENLDRRV